MSQDKDAEIKAKAFAWRAIGCAVWLGIGFFLFLLLITVLPVVFR